MDKKGRGQAQPEAAHAQPANPQTTVLEKQGLAGPPYQEQLDAAGQARPDTGQTRLQDVLPEVTELAQKVGGFKKLAEIAETLEKSNE